MFGAITVALTMAAATSTAADLHQDEPAPLRVGLLLGEPTGVTLTAGLWRQLGLQVEGGYSTNRDTDVVIAADLLWSIPELFGSVASPAKLTAWTGLGARVALGFEQDTGHRAGLRVPFGISYLAHGGTTEIFAQVAPSLSFSPDVRVAVGIGAGLRMALFD